jgi:DNA topoisomerase VI subunit B
VREGDEVVVRVADTGRGIAPDMLPHVFDLFVQERQNLDRSRGGLGLGLAIVRNLVQLHGGAASVESRGPGHGSTFIVRLPALAGTTDEPPVPLREHAAGDGPTRAASASCRRGAPSSCSRSPATASRAIASARSRPASTSTS